MTERAVQEVEVEEQEHSNLIDFDICDYQKSKVNEEEEECASTCDQKFQWQQKKKKLLQHSYSLKNNYLNTHNTANTSQFAHQSHHIEINSNFPSSSYSYSQSQNKRSSQEIMLHQDYEQIADISHNNYLRKIIPKSNQENDRVFNNRDIGPWEQEEKHGLYYKEMLQKLGQNQKEQHLSNHNCSIQDNKDQQNVNRQFQQKCFSKTSFEFRKQGSEEEIQQLRGDISRSSMIRQQEMGQQNEQQYMKWNSSNIRSITPKVLQVCASTLSSSTQTTSTSTIYDTFLKKIPIKKQPFNKLRDSICQGKDIQNSLPHQPNLYKLSFHQEEEQTSNKHLKIQFAHFLKEQIRMRKNTNNAESQIQLKNGREDYQKSIDELAKRQQSSQSSNNRNRIHNNKGQTYQVNNKAQRVERKNQETTTEEDVLEMDNNIINIEDDNNNYNHNYNYNYNYKKMNEKECESNLLDCNKNSQRYNYENSQKNDLGNSFTEIAEPIDGTMVSSCSNQQYAQPYQQVQQTQSEYKQKSLSQTAEDKQIFVHYNSLQLKQNIPSIKHEKNTKRVFSDQMNLPFSSQSLFANIFQKNSFQSNMMRQQHSSQSINAQQQYSSQQHRLARTNKHAHNQRNSFYSNSNKRTIQRFNSSSGEVIDNLYFVKYNIASANEHVSDSLVQSVSQFKHPKLSVGNINLQRHNQQVKEKERKLKEEEDLYKFMQAMEKQNKSLTKLQENPTSHNYVNNQQQENSKQLDIDLKQNFRIQGFKQLTKNNHTHQKSAKAMPNQTSLNFYCSNYFIHKDKNNNNLAQKSSTAINFFQKNPIKNKSSVMSSNILQASIPNEEMNQTNKEMVQFSQLMNIEQQCRNDQQQNSQQQKQAQRQVQQSVKNNKTTLFVDKINIK